MRLFREYSVASVHCMAQRLKKALAPIADSDVITIREEDILQQSCVY